MAKKRKRKPSPIRDLNLAVLRRESGVFQINVTQGAEYLACLCDIIFESKDAVHYVTMYKNGLRRSKLKARKPRKINV